YLYIVFTCFLVGISNQVKRRKELHHLHQLKAHIIFLQETHLKVSQHSSLRCRWVGQMFHYSFQNKARGVAILLHRSVPFTCSNVIADPHGRYIIVNVRLLNMNVLLVNIYAPNWDNGDFFQIGGDFNCWLDPHLDRSSTKPTTMSTSARVVRTFMSEFAVSDPWRIFHNTFTRIDYFLVDDRLLNSISSCSYNPIVVSDHAPSYHRSSLSNC
uniref:exodeoxyribonuclease III n=1 Tax=Salmo trutta TaxID=8032 RepID=A0A673VV21_SALTR